MSELRKNPLTGQWVIIAEDRGQRPDENVRQRASRNVPSYVETCPFCPGNENETPLTSFVLPDDSAPGQWQIRAFANKYPALDFDSPVPHVSESPLFVARSGVGAHEVLVESPLHNRFPFYRGDEEMGLLMRAYRERYIALKSLSNIRYVLIFKNHGELAGTSLEHPHSQIMAMVEPPKSVTKTGAIADEHYRKTGDCLTCRIADEEIRLGTRVIDRDEQFVVFSPFAASRPAETWIVPLSHRASFGRVPQNELNGLASTLRKTLKQLGAGFSEPDFNYLIHSSPKEYDDDSHPYWHWYLQIIPRTTKAAGFELGTGIYINTMSPETSARKMRETAI